MTLLSGTSIKVAENTSSKGILYMRIAILAHNLRLAGGLLVGRNVVATLPEIAPMHTYLMIVPQGSGYPDFDEVDNVEVLQCPKINLLCRGMWERTVLRRVISEFQPDWIWALGNIAVTPSPCKQSLLLHNSHRVYRIKTPRQIPLRSRLFKWLSDQQLRHSLRWVNRLYCQTETMCKLSHEMLRFPMDRIGLCPNAFSPSIKPVQYWPEELESFRGRFILLCLTRYYPHKNLDIIVETFSRYRDVLQDVVCVLPIDKDQGKGALALIDRIHTEGLEDQIACVGTIPQQRLGNFYFAADVMFLPTLLESFSGTYLEAMQLDRPILTSDRDFAWDVCDDAAVYIDPLSPDSVKDGILMLKNSRSICQEAVAKGRKRLQQHLKTWPEIIRNVLDQEGIEHD